MAALVFRRPLSRWPRKFRRPVGRSLVALRRMLRNPGTAAVALGLSLTIQGSFVLLNAALGHAVGITVPPALVPLATDGCLPPALSPPDAWPAIDQVVIAQLRHVLGYDRSAAGLTGLTDAFPGIITGRSESVP